MKCVHYYNFIRSGDGSPTLLSSMYGDNKLWPTLDTKEKKPTSKSYLCCSAAFTQIWQRLMYITLTWNTCILHWHGTHEHYIDMEYMYITLNWNTCIWHCLTWNILILHWHGTHENHTDMEHVYITLTWKRCILHCQGTHAYYTDKEHMNITLTWNTLILYWHGTY